MKVESLGHRKQMLVEPGAEPVTQMTNNLPDSEKHV